MTLEELQAYKQSKITTQVQSPINQGITLSQLQEYKQKKNAVPTYNENAFTGLDDAEYSGDDFKILAQNQSPSQSEGLISSFKSAIEKVNDFGNKIAENPVYKYAKGLLDTHNENMAKVQGVVLGPLFTGGKYVNEGKSPTEGISAGLKANVQNIAPEIFGQPNQSDLVSRASESFGITNPIIAAPVDAVIDSALPGGVLTDIGKMGTMEARALTNMNALRGGLKQPLTTGFEQVGDAYAPISKPRTVDENIFINRMKKELSEWEVPYKQFRKENPDLDYTLEEFEKIKSANIESYKDVINRLTAKEPIPMQRFIPDETTIKTTGDYVPPKPDFYGTPYGTTVKNLDEMPLLLEAPLTQKGTMRIRAAKPNILNENNIDRPFVATRAETSFTPKTYASGGLPQLKNAPRIGEIPIAKQSIARPSKVVELPINKPVETPTMRMVEPDISVNQKERGFSENTRTDLNNPDKLRDTFTDNPLTYEELGNSTTLAKAQEIFDQGYETARTQVGELASQMKPEAVPLAKLLARQATESGNIQGAREIISDVAEKLTQAGQFSQAARILREADPETFIMTMDKQLKKLNKEGLETYGKRWKPVDLTPDELDLISKIKRGDEKAYESAFETIGNRIADQMPASVTEKLTAWRHMAMLLNPKTHIRNITGNAIMMGMRKVAQRVSGLGQKAFLKQADRTQAVLIGKEYKQAAKDYFEANKNDLLKDGNKYNEGIKLNMPDKRVFKNNALENTRKFNYNLLQWGDNPFFKNAYTDRLASYAQAKGIKDFTKLPQEAFDIAKLEAEQATYKDASVIASFLNKVKHPGKNASLGQKATAGIAEAALPFTKTPINIIKRGIQYSPAGIINGLSKIKSNAGAAAAIDEMAKGLTGTVILGLGYYLAKSGILTGKAENDEDLRTYNANTGNSPFSVLGQYTYDWMQPFSVPLSVGVEIYNAVKDKPEDAKKLDSLIQNGDTSKLKDTVQKFAIGILDSLNASGDTVFNMSIMRGIRQLLGNGTQGVMEGLAQLPQNIGMQFVPTLANQAAGMIDPTVRQTYYKGNMLESAKATAISKIPFVSEKLQPKQTPWGQDVKRNDNSFIRAFSQFLSPGIMSQVQDIAPSVDTELRRLNKVGEKIQFPTVADTSFIWKGQKFELTPKEYTDFQRTLGQNTLIAYEHEIKTPEYQKLNDQEKAKELSGLISDAKDLAKFQLIQSKGLARSPEIMNVPKSFTRTIGLNKKEEIPLTFEQQNELADNINKYKKQFSLNKNLPAKVIKEQATARAEAEMKAKLFKK